MPFDLARLLPSPTLRLTVASKESLDVRTFVVREALGELFEIRLEVVASTPDVDLDAIVGKEATFQTDDGVGFATGGGRSWKGVVRAMELTRVEDAGLSTYVCEIVPTLWLLSQNRDYRIFQQRSEPEIALEILKKWKIEPEVRLEMADYKARKYRVQYGESDFHFVARLLQDAGIVFHFVQDGEETRLVLSDKNHDAEPKAPLPYSPVATTVVGTRAITDVRIGKRVRPGKYTLRDLDFRHAPTFPLLASARAPGDGESIEDRIERYHFVPDSMAFRGRGGDGTPRADDQGAVRTDLEQGRVQATRRLEAKRGSARVVTFRSTGRDVAPGDVVTIAGHPRRDLGEDARLLVVSATLEGDATGAFDHRIEARFADLPFRPPLLVRKPRVNGIESATVVGARGEEIHTEEMGRVRVQFHWDRDGAYDERSSCWIPVSQAWGGGSFGAVNLPRVGQEVFVTFLAGDPDRPVVIGRAYTRTQPTPYALPALAAVSGIRSESTPRGQAPAPRPAAGPRSSPLGGGTGMTTDDIARAVEVASPFAPASPAGTTHRWSGSEITFTDTAGAERLYIQAQRDFTMLVKNDRATTIANTDALRIGGDRMVEVANKEQIRIGSDQEIAVGGHHTLTVEKTIRTQSVTSSQWHSAKEEFAVNAKRIRYQAEEEIVLQVGASVILMRPDFVIVESPLLFLNPGAAAVAHAMDTGAHPQTPVEAAVVAAADASQGRVQRAIAEYIPQFRSTMPGVDITPRPGNRNFVLRQRLADHGLSPDEQDRAIAGYFDRPSPMAIDGR